MTVLALQTPLISDPKRNQLAASDPASSVWVNASAGSGKTTVLTARVTRLLLAGVAPEKILCLTYTRAGAAEMANRVTQRLSKWAVCDDDVLRKDLDDLQNVPPTEAQMKAARRLFARVLSCAGGLRIRTIHSFCQEILSRFPIEAGLPPHFSLIDEQELDVLGNEVLDDLLREAGEQAESKLAQALAVLVAAQGEAGFTQMLQEVMHARGQLQESVAQAGGEDKVIARMRGVLELEEGDTPESLRRHVMLALPEAKLKTLAGWLAQGTVTHSRRAEKLYAILAQSPEHRAAQFDEYRSIFLTQKNEPFKAFANKELLQKYPDIEDISAHEATLLQLTLERIEAAQIAEQTESVLFFGNAFAQRVAQRKAARAALDYDDLIMYTEKLLCRKGIAPWILYKLDNGIAHVLVDEAQDTSRAQWNIVQALTAEFTAGEGAQDKGRTLFVVGDEKQSIFSFQNADPEAFLSRRDFFAQRLSAAESRLEKIGLHTSFRSAPAILEAVDEVFSHDAARCGVSPDVIKHTAFAGREKIGCVEVWGLIKPETDDAANDGAWALPTTHEDEQDPQAELAQQIARKIKGWLTRREVLAGTDRPIAPSDIMILLRSRGRFADLMVRALKANAVPVTGVDRMRLISQLPVMDLLAAVRFVLLPEDDLNLATLLRSPLLGVSEEQLMELAVGRDGTLWERVKEKAREEELRSPQTHCDSPPLAGGVRGGVVSAHADCRRFIPDQTPTPPLAPPARGGESGRDCGGSGAVYSYLAAKLNEADRVTPFVFLSQLLNAPCPANVISGRQALWARLGAECLDPIEELLNEAQNFGNRHSPSLQNFLHWLTQSDTEIKRELDSGKGQEGGGQVRIMTVHASKGLEAPIVFLPDTVAMPLPQRMPKFQWTKDGVPLFIARKPDFGAARALWQKTYDKQMEEYRRLFYVALTRASNRLYICGWLGKRGDTAPEGSWYALAGALRARHQDYAPLDDDGSPVPEIVFADAVTALAPALRLEKAETVKWALPDWALLPVETPVAVQPVPRTDEPSAATPDPAFARGRIIHRLLQSLPDIAPENRAAAIARFLAHPRHRLTNEQRDEISGEVGRLLNNPTFAALFTADSLVEAPLTGSIDGVTVFRQVDRLCLRGDEVWIVDYKTNRPPPVRVEDIPAAYRRQMQEYRVLLSGIYPEKRVRCFLLWTYAPRLMEVGGGIKNPLY